MRLTSDQATIPGLTQRPKIVAEAAFALVNLITETDRECLLRVLSSDIQQSFDSVQRIVKNLCMILHKANEANSTLVPIIFDALGILIQIDYALNL